MSKERLVSSDDAPIVVGLAAITIFLIVLGAWISMTT